MKTDGHMYEKIYQIMRFKIECGLLPEGTKLPSRADLCREYATSEKTVRRVLEMLAEEGLIETSQRKRPTVIFNYSDRTGQGLLPLQKADATAAGDILKTGIFLGYPVITNGIHLCTEEDWRIPEAIFAQMDPGQATGFWRLSNKFWRFFLTRNENELIVRAIDSIGLSDLDPLPGTKEIRADYYDKLREFIQTVKYGGDTRQVHFADLSSLYGFLPEEPDGAPNYRGAPDSPLRVGSKELRRRLQRAQERYSCVYMDILGLIAIGRYQPGDRLPSHAELQRIYGVSVDTTIKAVQILQEWGVVSTVRGKGIFVQAGLEELRQIHIDPALIACHVRRFLDSIELLALTVEGVAAHVASSVKDGEAEALYKEIDNLWNGPYLYQLSPSVLMDFIVKHIQYDALRAIYEVLQNNQHIGRSIPHLVNRAKTPASCKIYHDSMEAAEALIKKDTPAFAKKTADIFKDTLRLVKAECRRLDYWDAAMQVYDGSILWK